MAQIADKNLFTDDYVRAAASMTVDEVLDRLTDHLAALHSFTPALSMNAEQTEELFLPLTIRDEDDLVLTRKDGQRGYREFQIEALYNSLGVFGQYVKVALDASYHCVVERAKNDHRAMHEWTALRDATYNALGILTQQALNAREQNRDMAKAYKQLRGLVDLALDELSHLILKVRGSWSRPVPPSLPNPRM